MNKKILIASIFATFMLLAPMTSVVGVSNVEDNNQISILNPPQPSPIITRVDFNITFYKPSSMTYQRILNPSLPYIWHIGRFSVLDFSNSPVGKIEYIEQSTGSETTKTFTYFMVGFFWAGVNFSDLNYNKSTGLGYITGTDSLLFYFGL
jgi:hypothetical protein